MVTITSTAGPSEGADLPHYAENEGVGNGKENIPSAVVNSTPGSSPGNDSPGIGNNSPGSSPGNHSSGSCPETDSPEKKISTTTLLYNPSSAVLWTFRALSFVQPMSQHLLWCYMGFFQTKIFVEPAYSFHIFGQKVHAISLTVLAYCAGLGIFSGSYALVMNLKTKGYLTSLTLKPRFITAGVVQLIGVALLGLSSLGGPLGLASYFIGTVSIAAGSSWWLGVWVGLVTSLPENEGVIMTNWSVFNAFSGWPAGFLSFFLISLNNWFHNEEDVFRITRTGFYIGVGFVGFIIILCYVLYLTVIRKDPVIYRKILTESDDNMQESEVTDLMLQAGFTPEDIHRTCPLRTVEIDDKMNNEALLNGQKNEQKEETRTNDRGNQQEVNDEVNDKVNDNNASMNEIQPLLTKPLLMLRASVHRASVNNRNNGNNKERCYNGLEYNDLESPPVKQDTNGIRPFGQIIGDTWDILLGMFLLYFGSFCFFPIIISKMKILNTTRFDTGIITMVTISLWAFLEPLPRWVAGMVGIPRKAYLFVIVARSVFFSTIFLVTLYVLPKFGFFGLTAPIPAIHWIVPILYVVTFGFSAGYLMTAGFLKIPEGISNTREQVLVGSMLANAELTGQMLGAIISFFWGATL